MGGALLHSTKNHKHAPGVRVQNVPRLQTTPLWLGEAPGVGWRVVTLHCLRALCLATGLGFHSLQTMGCPKGARTELRDLPSKRLPGLRVPLI